MKEIFVRFKNFLGPYDYRPGFIYATILVFNLSNLRTYTFDYPYGIERIQFFLKGLLTYALLGLPLYFILKISRSIWINRRKTLPLYLLEMLVASLITLLANLIGQKFIIPRLGTVNFIVSGVFIGELVTRFIFGMFFVAITHNRLRFLGEQLKSVSALNNELNVRYATLVESDEEIRHHASTLLHDRIQAKLMLAAAKLMRLSEVVSDEGKLGMLPVVKEIEQIRSIDVREVSQLLTPNLDGEGLIGSCENLAKEFSDGVDFRFFINDEVELFRKDLKLGIYRIIEQGVINSIKHGPASQISIRIIETGDNTVCVEVIDNGPGGAIFAPGKGSVIIDAWLSILDGRKEIETKPGNGFTLRAYLPTK